MTRVPPTLSLVVRRIIRAKPERLFEAWTTPAQLRRWWGPDSVECSSADVDLRVGGRFRIANRFPDGRVLFIEGVFETIEPPHRLVYTWTIGDTDTPERVTVRFEPAEQATEVIVVHERIGTSEAQRGHERGWIGCLDGLEAFVANPG